MEEIIEKIPVELLQRELTPERLLRHTNKGGNEIYIVDAHNSPNVMREIGRLREIAFRHAGGGTGLSCDIDEFDTMDEPCQQLLVWDPEHQVIVGAYRFILGDKVKMENGVPKIATSHMFKFSQRFIDEYLPYTIELGRSFVTLEYQSTLAGSRAIYALDNLWDGLGALTIVYPHIKYMFGKFTMYPSYSVECRNALLYAMKLYFHDDEHIVTPIEPISIDDRHQQYAHMFCGNDFKEDYLRLNTFIRSKGYNIPPLVNAYMNLSPTMKMFGTAINHEFGEVEESGILISIAEIHESKKIRHIESYEKELKG